MNKREFAVGRRWWQHVSKPAGGYVLVREQAMLDAWQKLSDGEIQLRDFRLWLACFEARARRCQLDTTTRRPTYRPTELGKLIGCPQDRLVRTSALRLEAQGLACLRAHRLTLSDGARVHGSGRLVPIPRQLLRRLCLPASKAFLGTALGHILRCLFYRKGEIVSGGYCKASEVATLFGVSERAVRDNRQRLIDDGVLDAFHADQRRLNRLGLPVRFALEPANAQPSCESINNQSAVPRAATGTKPAGPIEYKNPSCRKIKHQNPAKETLQSKGGREGKPQTPRANIRSIRIDDLAEPTRVLELYKQAVHAGLHPPGEANRLAFAAMAQRAVRVGQKNPPGLFAWLIRNGRSEYPSQIDEDNARRLITASDTSTSARYRGSQTASRTAEVIRRMIFTHMDSTPPHRIAPGQILPPAAGRSGTLPRHSPGTLLTEAS